jgi:hypothetical protein
MTRYGKAMANQQSTLIDSISRERMIDTMERRFASVALTVGISVGALILTGCATTEARISNNPEIYQRLSPRDQALVSQGQVRPGMSMDAVWLAWGTPEQKIPGPMRNSETWVYVRYDTPFPSYGVPYYYGPFDWSYIPPKFPYPSRGVTFSKGRVVFFRYLPPPPP